MADQQVLDGKVALVTGASRGIGRACAEKLAQMGATVVGTATTPQGAERISEYLRPYKESNLGLVLDVTKTNSVEDVLETMKEQYGLPGILVNNAAITRDNIVLRMKEDEWDDVIQTNLTALYRLSKICLKGMFKSRWGRIINISSVVGMTGNMGQANYAAAKAGVLGFTKSLAIEVASRGITVNAIAPGFIDTDMTKGLEDEHRQALMDRIPLNRLGQPDDIGACVAFLASPDASYITGQTLQVNGGMYMT